MVSNTKTSQDIKQYAIAIVGANGYSGRELVKLLAFHPAVSHITCFIRDMSWNVNLEWPYLDTTRINCLPLDELKHSVANFHTLFLATPVEVSLSLAPFIFKTNVNVIDLSGAFRLDPESFQQAYHQPHTATLELGQAQYGLCPWQQLKDKSAQLIANPGCYATAILMALLPLLKAKLLDAQHLVIDAKSGISGAGRTIKPNLHFCEIADNCLPYKVGVHQHLPEIIRYAQVLSDCTINPMMTTHLLPVRRGIIAGIYGFLQPCYQTMSPSDKINLVHDALHQAYNDYPLLTYKLLSNNEQDKQVLALTQVVGSCRTHIGFLVKGNHVYLYSCIDNLLKGAASQAVENFNALQSLPLSTALLHQEVIV